MVEHQRQIKSRKGSTGETINPYRCIQILPQDKAKFPQLSSFIPTRPTSPNFPQWAIKSINSDSEYELETQSALDLMPKNIEKNVNVEKVPIEISGTVCFIIFVN